MNPHIGTILAALEVCRGDDLNRAKKAFGGMTDEQMNQEYGQSGRTRSEIIADYEKHDAKFVAAINWIKSIA